MINNIIFIKKLNHYYTEEIHFYEVIVRPTISSANTYIFICINKKLLYKYINKLFITILI